jgi:hypothetical protein
MHLFFFVKFLRCIVFYFIRFQHTEWGVTKMVAFPGFSVKPGRAVMQEQTLVSPIVRPVIAGNMMYYHHSIFLNYLLSFNTNYDNFPLSLDFFL